MHPDAEVLTAFAEQLVTDTEREEVLAHIATCGRCRDVVFLTQKMAEAEEPSRGAAALVPKEKTGLGWFAGWNWAWIPVAALAGIVGFAVIEHSRRAAAPTTQMAQSAPPPESPLSTAINVPPMPKPSMQPRMQASRQESERKAAAPSRTDRDEELDRRSGADKDEVAAQKKNDDAKATDSLREAGSNEPPSTLHGTLQARAKSSAIGGPMLQNQIQQQNNAQMQRQQNYSNHEEQSTAVADSANKPVAAPIQPGPVSQTATVEVSGAAVPISPAPAAAPALSAVQLQTESAELSEVVPGKAKAGVSILPSKRGVLSQARAGRTTVAIDTAGSVFASEDGGKHWQAVNSQWNGRPVLVKSRSTVAGAGALLKQSAPRFELTTDRQEIWMSADGKTWTLKAP